MKPYAGALSWVIRLCTEGLCVLDTGELNKIPKKGPLILVGNHVNFLDVPVVRPRLHPRDVIGLAKVETYDNPLLDFLFKTWGSIPIERGVVDRTALTACFEVLSEGKLLAVAPEGTRSGDGKLQRGKPGIVLLAVRSNIPLLSLAYWGSENYLEDWKHLRRTPFHVRVGRPYIVDTHGEALTKEVRQRIADEIMLKLAELLPAPYQGVYAHPEQETYHYLRDCP